MLGYTFFSPGNPLQSAISEEVHAKHFHKEFDQIILSKEAGRIISPMLLINGRYDTNVPFFDTQNMYEAISTPTNKKKIVLLEASGHLPMLTEPKVLAKTIIQFLQ